jgi:hypothetical protein
VSPNRVPEKDSSRRKVIVPLAVGIALLFGILLSQSSFDLPAFLNPDTNRELLFFAAITVVISALFAMMTSLQQSGSMPSAHTPSFWSVRT